MELEDISPSENDKRWRMVSFHVNDILVKATLQRLRPEQWWADFPHKWENEGIAGSGQWNSSLFRLGWWSHKSLHVWKHITVHAHTSTFSFLSITKGDTYIEDVCSNVLNVKGVPSEKFGTGTGLSFYSWRNWGQKVKVTQSRPKEVRGSHRSGCSPGECLWSLPLPQPHSASYNSAPIFP